MLVKILSLPQKGYYFYLNLNFTLLGVGLLTDSLTTLYAYGQLISGNISLASEVLNLGNWIFSMAEIVAFSLLAYLYIRQATVAFGGLALLPLISKTYTLNSFINLRRTKGAYCK